jgi:hypothetical protein
MCLPEWEQKTSTAVFDRASNSVLRIRGWLGRFRDRRRHRKKSTISSGESDITLPVERKLLGEPIRSERHLRR